MRHRWLALCTALVLVELVPAAASAASAWPSRRIEVPPATPALAASPSGTPSPADIGLPPPPPGVPTPVPAAVATPAPHPPSVAAAATPAAPAGPTTPLPANSGTGRRIVYDMGTMHVWLVEVDGTVARDYPVSGHKYRKLPGTGQFWVYSKSRYTGVAHSPTRMEYMVRFAVGESGTGIGFHDIPTKRGKAIESERNLGQPASHGCVRQSEENAVFLWAWAPVGTVVNVVDTTGRVPAARPGNFPRGARPLTPMERQAMSPQLVVRTRAQ